MELEFITIATEERLGLQRLVASAKYFGFSSIVAGLGEIFPGYGWKFKRMLTVARDSRADLILFADAYDSICLAPASDVLAKFSALGHPIVFSHEPDPRPEVFLHLNSGLMIAERGALLDLFTDELLADFLPDHFNDQLQLQALMSWDPAPFSLDERASLFWTHSAARHLPENFSACLVHGPHSADLSSFEDHLRQRGVTWPVQPLTPV